MKGGLLQTAFYFLGCCRVLFAVFYDDPLLLSSTRQFCFPVVLQNQAHNKFNLLSIIKLG